MAKKEDIIAILTNNKVQLAITVIGVLITLGNFWIAARISPVAQDIAIIAQDIKANDARDESQHPTFVTKTELDLLVDRIDHISSRVDSIYSIVATK